MRKIICDRCGREITSNQIGCVFTGWRARSDHSLLRNANPYQDFDFCETCIDQIKNVIDNRKDAEK